MGFTRNWLKEILQDDSRSPAEKADAIMDGHLAVTDAIKTERDGYKEQADTLPELQKQLEKLTEEKKKFEDEKKAFNDFKNKVERDAEIAKVKAAYKDLLIGEKYTDKWVGRIMDSTDFSEMKLDNEGRLVDEQKLKDSVNEKWSDVKSVVQTKGAEVEKPLNASNGKMTRTELDQKLATIKDASERQKLISENLNLYGKG